MESELPEELVKNLQEKTQQMKHNWMYSFMPGPEARIYLVGYCKTCDNSVSSLVNIKSEFIASNYWGGWTKYDQGAKITKAGIPKWGCIPVQELAAEL